MFQDVAEGVLKEREGRFSVENIQFELFNTYIKYSSEKLALKEAQLLTQTELFLDKYIDLAYLNDKKSLNDCCTTEASIEYYCNSEKQSTNKSRGSRNAFQRKTKFLQNKQTKGTIADALQQIKEVCSERTIFTTQHLFKQYQRLLEDRNVSEYRDNQVRKKKEKCETCDQKDSQLLFRTREFQEKLANLSNELDALQRKCHEGEQALEWTKKQCEETDKQRKAMFSVCKDFLKEKQTSLSGKVSELKLIERSICNSLRQVVETAGCLRCEVVRSVRTQLLQYRRYYQGEFLKLEKWYQKCRKQMTT